VMSTHSSPSGETIGPGFRWFIFIFLFVVLSLAIPLNVFWTVEQQTIEGYIEVGREGLMQRRLALLALGLLSWVSFFSRKGMSLRIQGVLGFQILFFLLWTTISIIWAEDIILTGKRLAVVFLLFSGAVAVAKQFSFNDILKFTFLGCGFTLLAGFTAEMVLNTFNPFDVGYRFSGVMHSNGQGMNCAVLFISAFVLARIEKNHRLFYRAAGLIAFLFLVLTRSRTATVSALLALICFSVLISSNRSKKIAYFLLAVMFTACLSYFVFGENIIAYIHSTALLGRVEDSYASTFIGRIELWNECLKYLDHHPFLGYGYGSFWTPKRLAEIPLGQGWVFASAHSGYIEMLLGLGIIGGMAYLSILITGITKSISFYKRSGVIGYAFASVMLIWLFFNSITESIVIQSYIPNFVCFTCFVKLGFMESGFTQYPEAETIRSLT